jgi:hypothetical protein
MHPSLTLLGVWMDRDIRWTAKAFDGVRGRYSDVCDKSKRCVSRLPEALYINDLLGDNGAKCETTIDDLT